MTLSLTIDARFDAEAQVWLATSADLPGLVVEAGTWPAMIEEVSLAIPICSNYRVNPPAD